MSELEENEESPLTGLPFPKSWKGAYVFVLLSFVLWLSLLWALKEFAK